MTSVLDAAKSIAKDILGSAGAASFTQNRPYVDFLREILAAKTFEERRSAEERLSNYARQAVFDQRVAQTKMPVGVAGTIFQDVEPYIDSIPHLGALSELVAINSTRADYVRIWMDALLKIKQLHPGLGLGSSARFPYSGLSVTYEGKPVTKLEALQTVVAIANYGHLFGTFSTERAFMYHLHADMQIDEFLKGVDDKVRREVGTLLRSCELWGTFYAISAWKISRWTDNAKKRLALEALKMCLAARNEVLGDVGLQAIGWVYRKSRQAVTQELHAMLGIGPSAPTMSMEEIVSGIMHGGGIVGYCPDLPETRIGGFISTLETTHTELFFSSPRASERVLRHLKQFRIWYAQQKSRGRRLPDLIEELSERPSDWPALGPTEKHFSRIEIPNSSPHQDWISIVEKWKTGDWGRVDFVLATMDKGFGCDIFFTDHVDASGLRSLAQNLASHHEQCTHINMSEAERRYAVSIAQFGINVMTLCIAPGCSVALRPGSASTMAGLAVVTRNMEHARRYCRDYINRIDNDDNRARELHWFVDFCKSKSSESPILMFVGKLLVYSSDSGSNEFGEIDVAWAEFQPGQITWTLVEVKVRKQRGGDCQLRRLASVFNGLTEPQESKSDTLVAWTSELVYR